MIGGVAQLRRSASRARASLSEVLDDARDYADGARELANEATDDSQMPGTPPEEQDIDEARGRVEDVYEPLLGGQSSAGSKSRSRARGEHVGEAGSKIDLASRKVEVALSYVIFFILGACILLPWNAVIISSSYFGARLRGSRYETSYASWVSLIFCICNLLFLGLANYNQYGVRCCSRVLELLGCRLTLPLPRTTVEPDPTHRLVHRAGEWYVKNSCGPSAD